jgi:membrane fusion protein, multidrug efflux system
MKRFKYNGNEGQMRWIQGALIVSVLTLNSGCGNSPGAADKKAPVGPAEVITTIIGVESFAERVEALGTVLALESIEISANVTETIEELYFEDGDWAKAGDPLAKLSSSEEEASLEVARANLAEQEREIARLQALADDGAVSQVRLQGYLTQKEIALQRVAEVQARLKDRLIVAPFEGTLGFRMVSKGALVSPGQAITTLDALDPVKVDFTVPETFLGDLTQGLEISAHSEAYPEMKFAGKVSQVDTRVNPVTRSITVRALIPNPDKILRPGMLLTTYLQKNPRESVAVPERCLVSVQSNHYVYKIVSKEGSTVAERAPVEIGARFPGILEIISGIAVGDQVVTDGLLGLKQGDAVKVIGNFEGPAKAYSPTQSDSN